MFCPSNGMADQQSGSGQLSHSLRPRPSASFQGNWTLFSFICSVHFYPFCSFPKRLPRVADERNVGDSSEKLDGSGHLSLLHLVSFHRFWKFLMKPAETLQLFEAGGLLWGFPAHSHHVSSSDTCFLTNYPARFSDGEDRDVERWVPLFPWYFLPSPDVFSFLSSYITLFLWADLKRLTLYFSDFLSCASQRTFFLLGLNRFYFGFSWGSRYQITRLWKLWYISVVPFVCGFQGLYSQFSSLLFF